MIFQTSIQMSLRNLRANKMRSFLTMLGMIIGISSVIIVLSVGAGAESLILNQIKNVGSNLIGILPGGSEEEGPPAAVFGVVITTLTNADKDAIKEKISGVIGASSYVTAVETASWQNQKLDTSIQGVSADYPLLSDSTLSAGYFFNDEDEQAYSNVAVLGSQVKEELFNGQDPLGQMVKIKKQTFRIIGVMDPKGVSGFQNVDNMIFIPVTTAQTKIVGIKHVGYIRVKVADESKISETVDEIKLLLRDRHDIDNPTKDDFTVGNPQDRLESLGTVTNALKLFLAAIAAISLLVGGIGIMNIMFAAVSERVKEIGLKKALGAKSTDITWQFLIETIIISLSGALIGIILGVLFSALVALIVRSLDYDWDFVITLSSLAVAAGVSILIGLIFGIYPARKAAKLDPIVALRYE